MSHASYIYIYIHTHLLLWIMFWVLKTTLINEVLGSKFQAKLMRTAKHGIAYRTLSEGAVKLTTCPQARITSSHQFYDVLAWEFSRDLVDLHC
jgi:hypothetical protein